MVRIHTKLLVVVYSAWSEASLSKIVHTPDGLSVSEIQVIKKQQKIEGKWKKCIDIAIKRASPGKKSGDLENRVRRLNQLIDEYIIQPSQLRNKIAHGQWSIALNQENTATNSLLSSQIHDLDPVIVEKWFEVHRHLAQIVEDIVESPKKAFHRDYWVHLTEIESYLDKTKNRDVHSKMLELKKKMPLSS